MDSELKRRMSPSLSLITLAALTPEQHEVYIEDENINSLNFDDSPDIVGITVNVDTFYRAVETAEKYRNRGIKVIFGGIHASANYEEMLAHCDSVCIGEAEGIWQTILNDFINNELKKTYFSEVNTDLTISPIPKWSAISKKDYLYCNIIVTSRGCPYKCDFCYNSCEYVKSNFRNKQIESVLKEIKEINLRQIMFIDDNFIGNLKWTSDFLDKIRPLKIVWHSAVSANLVNYPDLISKMADTGCRSLFIGFESINHNSIRSVNKKQNKIEEYDKLIELLHRNNIMVNASLVFGFDSDDVGTFENTLDWLVSRKIETMTAHILTPYPGTKLHQKLLNENRIIDFDLRHYNTSNTVFMPKLMTPEELKNGYLNIYKDFYSLKNIIKRIPESKDIILPYFLFNLFYRKYGKLTSVIGKFGYMNRIGAFATKLSYGID